MKEILSSAHSEAHGIKCVITENCAWRCLKAVLDHWLPLLPWLAEVAQAAEISYFNSFTNSPPLSSFRGNNIVWDRKRKLGYKTLNERVTALSKHNPTQKKLSKWREKNCHASRIIIFKRNIKLFSSFFPKRAEWMSPKMRRKSRRAKYKGQLWIITSFHFQHDEISWLVFRRIWSSSKETSASVSS